MKSSPRYCKCKAGQVSTTCYDVGTFAVYTRPYIRAIIDNYTQDTFFGHSFYLRKSAPRICWNCHIIILYIIRALEGPRQLSLVRVCVCACVCLSNHLLTSQCTQTQVLVPLFGDPPQAGSTLSLRIVNEVVEELNLVIISFNERDKWTTTPTLICPS